MPVLLNTRDSFVLYTLSTEPWILNVFQEYVT